MGIPQRIRLERRAGWRMPPGAVSCARPHRFGNPYLLGDVSRRFPSLTERQCEGFVVNEFKDLVRADGKPITDSLPSLTRGGPREPRTCQYPTIDEIRAELGGHDLGCFCHERPEHACHVDVLLIVANPDISFPWEAQYGAPFQWAA